MTDIQNHLKLFPPRLRAVLERFSPWDRVFEIRLRACQPLSLTSFDSNLLLDESGHVVSDPKRAIQCQNEDLIYVLSTFCGGSAYRYFDHLTDGYAVDAYGWRLALAAQKVSQSHFMPEKIEALSLRIPRSVPHAADTVLEKMGKEGIFSLLVLSPPGGGKTTLLRALATALGRGDRISSPIRVAVIDQRKELFPERFARKDTLIDLLPEDTKGEGIEKATRLLTPQVILLDEIGGDKDAESVISSCRGGVTLIASAHADSLAQAKQIPYLARLLDFGIFRYALILSGKGTELSYYWERVS